MRKIMIKMLVISVCWVFVWMKMDDLKQGEMKIENVHTYTAEKEKALMVSVVHHNEVKEMELENYLLGVIASEMPYSFEMEALKAQCVAARTYVMQRGGKVDDSTSSQVYHSMEELQQLHPQDYDVMIETIHKALEATSGEVMKYQGEYISALFYSSCNGRTNDASWYYQNEVPYLKSVDSFWDLQYENTNAVIEKSVRECMQQLGVSSFHIGMVQKYENGYIQKIAIGDQVFSGREVREKLGLRSSCFSFEVQGDTVFIYTSGFGHGVGMSQYGALGMAKEGYTYQEILKHYYQGVEIVNLKEGV